MRAEAAHRIVRARGWGRGALLAAALLACGSARAEGEPLQVAPTSSPGAIAQTPGASSPSTPSPAATDAAAAAWERAFQGMAGVGFYERAYAGVEYQPTPAQAIGLFGGSSLGRGSADTWDVGLSYTHALKLPIAPFESGLATKAIYWEQSNPDYDWKMMSLVLGAYLARDLAPSLTLSVDGGVALSFSLDTTRKQNVNYEYPTRWNGSVSVALRYRFSAW
jgi:hypothetical protein